MAKPTKLIVLAAFDEDGEWNWLPAFDPRQVETEERAVREAKALSGSHVSVVAWSRDADALLGEYGPPAILYQTGYVPDME